MCKENNFILIDVELSVSKSTQYSWVFYNTGFMTKMKGTESIGNSFGQWRSNGQVTDILSIVNF